MRGSSFCEHGKHKAICKECNGKHICEHGNERVIVNSVTALLYVLMVEIDTNAKSAKVEVYVYTVI